jgi:hypothetical protein
MYLNPKITFTCVTYNRVKMLRNMLLSFCKTNEYENFEWVILHHDCTDETEDFLNSIVDNEQQYNTLKGKVRIIKGFEDEYIEYLKQNNIDMSSTKKQSLSHFAKWRNDIAKYVSGDLWIDLPDDHQFIYKGNYCQELIDVLNDNIKKSGKDDVSVITFRTRFYYRIMKANNKKSEKIKTLSGAEYYIIETAKTHDEWRVMSMKNFKKIGGYPQIENATEIMKYKWNKPKHPQYFFYHHEQMNKTFYENKLKRLVLKVPIMHDCLDSKYEASASENECIFPIFDSKKELNDYCTMLDRPVAIKEFEQLTAYKRSK